MSLSKWVDKVEHLRNYMNKDCNEVTDCNFKKSLFIEFVINCDAVLVG